MRLSRTIHAIDLHACGEPGRVITGGVLDVPGRSMFEKMVHLREHGDRLRRLMLREPRGYPAANCNVILPATHPDAVAGYVITQRACDTSCPSSAPRRCARATSSLWLLTANNTAISAPKGPMARAATK